jgi:hypothetical protein
MVIPHNSLTTG